MRIAADRVRSLGATLFAAVVLTVGCGPSQSELASKRISDRPKPGFARILNATGGELSLFHKGRMVNRSVPAGEYGRLVPVGVGKQEFLVGAGEIANGTSISIDLATNKGHTVVALPGGKLVAITGEPRRPEAGNAYAVFLDADGKRVASGAKASGAGARVTFTSEQADYEITPGQQTIGGKPVDIKPDAAYTIVFWNTPNGKTSVYAMLNTPLEKPAAASASGG